MSENVLSVGIMVPLSRQLTKQEREEWDEILYDQGSNVRFNYEGTLAYTDNRKDEYGIHFGILTDLSFDNFEDLKQFDLGIEKEHARNYQCVWYNGSDSDMSMMTIEEFLKTIYQKIVV